jgi:capsular polysaccharide transport system permease protein
MSLKPSELMTLFSRGIHSLFPIGEAASWVEKEFPEEQGAWRRFRRVVYALFLRQLQRQLAGEYTAFVWLVFQPLIMILLFTAMHTVIRGRSSSSYDIVIFMGSGIVPFFLFRTILTSSLKVFKQNRGLYHYQQIKPIDTFVANIFFESALYAVVTILLLILATVMGIDVVPVNFDLFIVSVFWLILLGASWGLFLGVLSLFYEVVATFVSFLSFPLLILSAVFYPLSSLPPVPREWLLYNPLTHFMELIHASYIETLDARYVDYLYMTEWTIVPLFLGLWLYRRSEWKYVTP